MCWLGCVQFAPRQQCRLPQRWPNVGTIVPTLGQCWGNLHCWLVRLWKRLPILATHTTEPTHHQVTGLCVVWWCVDRSCVIRLGCVEGRPWFSRYYQMHFHECKVLYFVIYPKGFLSNFFYNQQLVVLTYELMFAVWVAHCEWENNCETGLLHQVETSEFRDNFLWI